MSSTQSKTEAPATTVITTTSNSNNNNSSSTEQPQTKRQKIEKIKSNGKNTKATTTTVVNKSPPPPDLIEPHSEMNGNSGKHLCSSLSSSAHSISTPSSSNNSPTSTPSSSRATSLTQLLNVQNIVNSLPSTAGIIASTGGAPTTSNGGVHNDSSATSGCSSACSSTDEVDRITLPDLLPINVSNSSTTMKSLQTDESSSAQDMREFEESLTKQCLCGVSELTLHKPFQSHYSLDANGQKRIAKLSEWPTNKLLQFLSNLQLLFDIYLKQNSKSLICARIMDVRDALIRNENNLIDEIIVLAGNSNAYVQFLAGRVLASFLVIAKQEMDSKNWLKKLVDNLFNFERLNHLAVQKIHFSLEIIKRIVEWQDIDLHPLEDEIVDTRGNAGISEATTTLSAAAVGGAGAARRGFEHPYLQFDVQQPTLETNYFAVHFRDEEEDERDDHDLDDDEEEEVEEEEEEEEDVDEDEDDEEDVDLHVHERLHRNLSQLEHFSNLANAHAHMSGLNGALPFTPEAAAAANFPTNSTNPALAGYQPSSSGAANYDGLTHFSNPAATTTSLLTGCHLIELTDSESFDTTQFKCITIKILENKWPALVKNMSALIANHLDIENAENCILNFLQLWENIISVKANLSIVETGPFYAQLHEFQQLLNRNLSCTVYKQMLCLFNEALCYGSTLALQDMLPEETCQLARQIVSNVKAFVESLPRRQPENIVSMIGFKGEPVIYAEGSLQSQSAHHTAAHLADDDVIEMDKTILQKMVLLVLKSIAVTVKTIRSDSSDSSIDSTDYDAVEDMRVINDLIRNVLNKLESFIKLTLEFHPECHFSKILIHLFDDQDDHLIEAMVCTLDVTTGISFRHNDYPLAALLNPVYTFLEFLKMISHSEHLLLDLLVSTETCFLLYLLRFLKYINNNWDMFEQSCHEFGMGTRTLVDAMEMLIRLRTQISHQVSLQRFPYNISPVMCLLENCERRYSRDGSFPL